MRNLHKSKSFPTRVILIEEPRLHGNGNEYAETKRFETWKRDF